MITKNLQEFYQTLLTNSPLIAIDYGKQKIGIAISNPERTIAMPLQVVENSKNFMNNLVELVIKYDICGLVIGLPVNMNGEVAKTEGIILTFAQEANQRLNIPIYLQDERLTTKAANNFLKSFGITRKQRNKNDDMVAASMILETSLNSMKLLHV